MRPVTPIPPPVPRGGIPVLGSFADCIKPVGEGFELWFGSKTFATDPQLCSGTSQSCLNHADRRVQFFVQSAAEVEADCRKLPGRFGGADEPFSAAVGSGVQRRLDHHLKQAKLGQ